MRSSGEHYVLCVLMAVTYAALSVPAASAAELTIVDGGWCDQCLNGGPTEQAGAWWGCMISPSGKYVEAWSNVTCTVLSFLPKTAYSYASAAKRKKIVWVDHERPAPWTVRHSAYGAFAYDWFYFMTNPNWPQDGGVVPVGGLWADLKATLDGYRYAGPEKAEWGVAKDCVGGGTAPGLAEDNDSGNPGWGTLNAEKEGSENGCVRAYIKAWSKVTLAGPYGNVRVDEDAARTTLSDHSAWFVED